MNIYYCRYNFCIEEKKRILISRLFRIVVGVVAFDVVVRTRRGRNTVTRLVHIQCVFGGMMRLGALVY